MFACQECGYRFRTVKAAERAAFGDDGCPKCGSSDVDLAPATLRAKATPKRSPRGRDEPVTEVQIFDPNV